MSDSVKVILNPLGEVIQVICGTPLVDVLHPYGIEFPCGGKGSCGGCQVKILRGELGMSKQHDSQAAKRKLSADKRLACMCYVQEDVVLEIAQYESIFLADSTEFEFSPQPGYGIAIDVGTTTVIGQLMSLSDGKIRNTRSILNSQSKHGADIMSRIEFAVHQRGAEILNQLIRKDIGTLVQDLTSGSQIHCSKIVMVGNNVMQHILGNFDLTGLSMYPFESVKHEFCTFTPDQLNIENHPDCNITFYPAIGSFIGSDILAGIISTGMDRSSGNTVLIDLGTNGEICVGNRDRIVCASTAAGPAFEGTNITMGMTAATGAISSLFYEDNLIKCHTIGNISPRGICGSGLIDAIALYHESGVLDPSGKIIDQSDSIILEGEVFLTQKDIYEFLLAKSAIASGIEILCRELNITKDDIGEVFIAGAFGNFINLENANKVGLVDFPVRKTIRRGNTALIGAKMALFQDPVEWLRTLQKCQHLSLESFADFQDLFVSKMFLT